MTNKQYFACFTDFKSVAGTTVKGAVDDLDLVIKTLEETGFTDRFYIHCDGALFGLMMPFVKRVRLLSLLPLFA